MTEPTAVRTELAPPPAGTYEQGIRVGDLVYLSGQTPREPSGVRRGDLPLRDQARMALDNLDAVARAAGSSLAAAVKVTVFLTADADAGSFDEVYREYVGSPAPARTLVRSPLVGFDVEVDAVLYAP